VVAKPEKTSGTGPIRIGVISDTHGYLDPMVLEIFAGVQHIIHAGDIMDPDTLPALERVAPVTAVAGNLDVGDLGKLPREVAGEVGGVRFVVGHKAGKVDGAPKDDHPDLIVFGHDHVQVAEWVDGSLYINPGTASSPHEEDDDPTVVVVQVEGAGLSARFGPLPRTGLPEGA
jgi:uncharacterized protein